MKQFLNILYHNARSIRSSAKQSCFLDSIKMHNRPDIVLISETWLDDQVASGEDPKSTEYYLATKSSRAGCNEHTAGGGVAIFVRRGLKATDYTNELKFSRLHNVQACKIRVEGIVITCFYRAPRNNGEEDKELFQYVMNRPQNEFIFGDLNFGSIDWDLLEGIGYSNSFMAKYMESGISQVIDFETCTSGNILDVLLTHDPERVADLVSHPNMTGVSHSSDHHQITCRIQTRTKQRKRQKPFWVDDFKRADFNKYREELKKRCDEIVKFYGDTEGLYEAVVKAIKEAWSIAVPKKKVDPNVGLRSEDEEIVELHRRLKRKRTAMKRSPNVQRIKDEAQRLTRKLHVKIVEKRELEQNRGIQGCLNAAAVISQMNKYDPRPRLNPGPLKVNGENIEDEQGIANTICDQYIGSYTECQPPDYSFKSRFKPKKMKNVKFRRKWVVREIKNMKRRVASGIDGISPSMLIEGVEELADHLCNLYKNCVRQGTIPSQMRKSIVTPLYKGGSRSDPGQYRPISVTSNLLKVCEKVISKAIMKHMEKNGIWAKTQFAFRTGTSVTSNLISHDLNINKIRRNGGKITIVLVDAKKAYDKMSFRVLHEGMCHAGLPEMLRKWFMNVLMDRSFQVRVGSTLSKIAFPTSGCLQGSAASPYLFNLACNVACRAIPKADRQFVSILQFADDLKVTADTRSARGCIALQNTLDVLEKWAEQHSIYFHGGKTKLLHMGTRRGPTWDYYLERTKLVPTYCARDLGVMYNIKENNHDHFANVIKAIESRMRTFRKSIRTRDIKTLTIAWNMLIASKITFGIQTWGRPNKMQMKRLCAVQRRFLFGAVPCRDCTGKKGPACKKHTGPEPIEMLIMRAEIGCLHDILSGRNRVEGKLYEEHKGLRTTRANEQGLLTKLKAKSDTQVYSYANRAVSLWNAVIKDRPKKYEKLSLERMNKPMFRQCLKETVIFWRPKELDLTIYNSSATERRIKNLEKLGIYWFRRNQ